MKTCAIKIQEWEYGLYAALLERLFKGDRFIAKVKTDYGYISQIYIIDLHAVDRLYKRVKDDGKVLHYFLHPVAEFRMRADNIEDIKCEALRQLALYYPSWGESQLIPDRMCLEPEYVLQLPLGTEFEYDVVIDERLLDVTKCRYNKEMEAKTAAAVAD